MSRFHLRRIRGLERTLQTLTEVERQRKIMPKQEPPEDQSPLHPNLVYEFSRPVIASVCVLTLFGDPKIDEPVDLAWQRCMDSPGWKSVRRQHPELGGNNRDDEAHPCTPAGAHRLSNYFFVYLLPSLSGRYLEILHVDKIDEVETVDAAETDAILAKAPRWLLWYTYVDELLKMLGRTPIDLSSMQRYARQDSIPFALQCLPEGPFELRPWPATPARDEYKGIVLPKGLSPRDRKRLIKNLDEEDRIRAAGDDDEPMSLRDSLDARKEALRRKYGC